jgi:hypothetical protein
MLQRGLYADKRENISIDNYSLYPTNHYIYFDFYYVEYVYPKR